MNLTDLHGTSEVLDGDGRASVDGERRIRCCECVLEEHRDTAVCQQQEVRDGDGLCRCTTSRRTGWESATEHGTVGHLQLQVADILATVLDVAVLVDYHNVILHSSTFTSHRQLVGLRVGDVVHLGLVVILRQCRVDGGRDHRANLSRCCVICQSRIEGCGDGRVGLRLGVVVRQVDGGLTNHFPIVGGLSALIHGKRDILILHILLLRR